MKPKEPAEVAAEWLEKFDADKDGKLAKDELTKALEEGRKMHEQRRQMMGPPGGGPQGGFQGGPRGGGPRGGGFQGGPQGGMPPPPPPQGGGQF